MHLPINVKSPNNFRKWQMKFNSAFKGLTSTPDRGEWSASEPVALSEEIERNPGTK
jgi:hypothetical protein